MTDEFQIEGGNTNAPQGLVIKMSRPKHWRCANGHEWEDETFSVTFSAGTWEKTVDACPICLHDASAKIAVPFEEVPTTGA